MSFAETDQSLVVFEGLSVKQVVKNIPADGVDAVGGPITVFVKTSVFKRFGAQDLFACKQEGNTLAQHRKCCTSPAPLCDIFPGGLWKAQRKPVKEGVIIVAGDIIDALPRTAGPGSHPHESIAQRILDAGLSGEVAFFFMEENRASQQITERIVEETERGEQVAVCLVINDNFIL